MSLTGPVFLTLLIVATLTAAGALVVLWPRLGAPGVPAVLLRAGLLVAVNGLVVLSVLSQLNAHYQFYASWSDLAGSLSHTPTTSTAGASPAEATGPGSLGVNHTGDHGRAAVDRVDGRAPDPFRAGPGVHEYTLTGAASRIHSYVWVDLPAGYTWRSAHRYPVIETFPGYPGAPTQWNSPMKLSRAIAGAVQAHQMRPAVLVEPETEIPPGVDTECVNGLPGEPQMETWLTADVPAWVEQHFQVATDRSGWASMGLSSGAWCAAMAAMLHPQQYAAAIAFGGYFRPEFSNYQPFAATSPQLARYNLLALAHRRPPRVALWLMTSKADPVSYPSSSLMLQAARPPLAVVSLVLRDAGHRTAVWERELPAALAWMGRTIPGFKPARPAHPTSVTAEAGKSPGTNRVG